MKTNNVSNMTQKQRQATIKAIADKRTDNWQIEDILQRFFKFQIDYLNDLDDWELQEIIDKELP